MMVYSAVIPLKDEEKSLPTLYKELTSVFKSFKKPYELIFVDDGSQDNSFSILKELQHKDKKVKIIKFRANFGKSEALSKGFLEAQGKIIVVLDADLQDDPHDIPKLISKLNEGFDLVNGWRINRADTMVKKISSFLFNKGTVIISGVNLHDFNCGFKVLTHEVAEEIYLHGELHRFIPVLAAKRKFRITEVEVHNRIRKYGVSKFGKLGITRGWKGMIDLLTTIFLSDYSNKPAHFFGKIGLPLFAAGFLMDLYVTYIKITTGTTQGKIPLLLAGVLCMLLGVQLLSTGLIAEMIAYYSKQKKD